MIFIKEDYEYHKYYVSDDARLICTDEKSNESMILADVSNEYDAISDTNGIIHFVMQGQNGELVYLKKENKQWKKYHIFKSKNGLKKLHNIVLKNSGNKLCAFYVMEHKGKKLLVRHRFSADKLYEEPVVLDITDGKRRIVYHCPCRYSTDQRVY